MSQYPVIQDITDEMLFGHDTAEMEKLNILHEYFYSKEQFRSFLNRENSLSIACAKKGVGKSAILRYLEYELASTDGNLVCSISGPDLARTFSQLSPDSKNPSMLINCWQLSICREINRTIGNSINLAVTDDEVTMTELAELTGKKSRNAIGMFIDRIKIKQAENIKLLPGNDRALLERYSEKKDTNIWLLVDDIDATFIYNQDNSLVLSTFLSACRSLINSINGLNIRSCVRSDVWTLIKTKDEALDKVEQYIFPITWDNEDETREILAKRISTYMLRKGMVKAIDNSRSYEYIDIVFDKNMRWGKDGQIRPPHVVIHTLSMGRPRWAIKLCKAAANRAKTARSEKIGITHINAALNDYGRDRLTDLYREHQHQCPQIAEMVQAFAGGPNKYAYDQLLQMVKNKILQRPGGVLIDGTVEAIPQIVARFLYRIGLITARQELDANRYAHIEFKDNPYVFLSTTNSGSRYIWEIHPAYRQPLELLSDRETAMHHTRRAK